MLHKLTGRPREQRWQAFDSFKPPSSLLHLSISSNIFSLASIDMLLKMKAGDGFVLVGPSDVYQISISSHLAVN
jgi:hypothetical protein